MLREIEQNQKILYNNSIVNRKLSFVQNGSFFILVLTSYKKYIILTSVSIDTVIILQRRVKDELMDGKTTKHLDLTKEEVAEYLKKFKKLVQRERYKISDTNREKNNEFIKKYSLSSKKIKNMLLELQEENFVYAVDNDKGFDEILYVFVKEYELNYWGETEVVPVYVKINMLEEKMFSVVVSFHELEKNIKLLFNGKEFIID